MKSRKSLLQWHELLHPAISKVRLTLRRPGSINQKAVAHFSLPINRLGLHYPSFAIIKHWLSHCPLYSFIVWTCLCFQKPEVSANVPWEKPIMCNRMCRACSHGLPLYFPSLPLGCPLPFSSQCLGTPILRVILQKPPAPRALMCELSTLALASEGTESLFVCHLL